MLEQRVGKLEEKVDRIEAILTRLEPKIIETLSTGAKQADLTKLQIDGSKSPKSEPPAQSRLTSIRRKSNLLKLKAVLRASRRGGC
ncbi:hypothetical protein [Methylocystis heyeri]|uniref:Uncharacterized protein n=1 Tax=Methylocystis heyeri TaxID=391905 RepID=A0A6B8KB54_9HYPH|nr:hypothetical protein [Methylocystis heyeri]QGM45594.1 hypothetical protein H2LOC_007720 [Methylocystis heyeri]